MTGDADLLRNYAIHRSDSAFAELVGRHLTLVYSTALRKLGGDSHLAKDVTQTVFVKLARLALPLSRHPALAGWLHTTARNAAAEVLRGEFRRRRREEKAQTMRTQEISSEELLDWRRVAPFIDDILGKLSRDDREAVLLRFLKGNSFEEIGAKIGLSENAARMRVERALEKARRLLAKRGINSTGAALAGLMAGQSAVAIPAGLAADVSVSALAVYVPVSSGLAILKGLEFMLTTKATVGAIGAFAILAIGGALHEGRLAQEYKASLSRAMSQNSQLAGSLQKSSKDVLLARRQLDQLQIEILRANRPHRTDPAASGAAGNEDRDKIIEDLKNGTVRFNALTNAGRATPRDTLETFLWAITAGSTGDIAKVIVMNGDTKKEADALFASLPTSAQDEYVTPEQMIAVFAAKWAGSNIPATGSMQIVADDDHGSGALHILTQLQDGTPGDFYALNGSNGWQLAVPKYIVDGATAELRGNVSGESAKQ